jgi:hypothetical protein
MAALLGGGDAADVPPWGEGVDQVRVSRLRLGKIAIRKGKGTRKEGRKDTQVGPLLRNAALGLTTENDEGTGSVIIANGSIPEGRGCGALKKA